MTSTILKLFSPIPSPALVAFDLGFSWLVDDPKCHLTGLHQHSEIKLVLIYQIAVAVAVVFHSCLNLQNRNKHKLKVTVLQTPRGGLVPIVFGMFPRWQAPLTIKWPTPPHH